MTMSEGQDRTLAGLAKIATQFSALAVRLPDFLNSAIKMLGDELGIDHCVIALVDERGAGRLIVRAASGLAAPCVGEILTHPAFQRVIETGEPALIGAVGAGRTIPQVHSCVSAPLVVHGRPVGLVAACRPDPGQYTGQDLNLMIVLARYFSSAIELARLHERPAAGVLTDALTDLPSERAFREAVERAIRLGQRHGEPLVVLSLDIDDLSTIRDRYGAAVCDTLLRHLARVLRGMLRESDIVARASTGFLLLLPRTPKRAGLSVAERIRRRANGVVAEGGPAITVSLGVGESPKDGVGAATLVDAVKAALEEAQRRGGDRVHTA
jgi:diguanylate cyclase (GGDEF)-like protein